MASDIKVVISDRYLKDPTVLGSPIAYDMYSNNIWIGSCIVFDSEESILDTSFDYYEKKGLATINDLFIHESFRGKGFGIELLRWVMNYLYTQRNMRYVELDDATDYFGRPDCIYRKVGFNYDRDDNHMMINLRHWFTSKRKNDR